MLRACSGFITEALLVSCGAAACRVQWRLGDGEKKREEDGKGLAR